MKRAFLFLLAACGPSGDAGFARADHCPCGDAAAAGPDPSSIPNEPLEDWDTTNAGPLTGIFAVEAAIKARAGVEVEIRQLLRLRIVQQGTRIHQKTTLCALRLPDVPGSATLTIPAALQALIQKKGTEDQGEYLSTGSVIQYLPPPFLVVVGAKLASPATDTLPTMQDLSAQLDEDMDGHPGVTIGASVLTCTKPELLYVALRTSGRLTGTVPSNDRIVGKVDVKLSQSILGYSDECLSVAAMLRIDVEPGSPFEAKRTQDADDIDRNGNVSCPEIVLRAPDTFGAYWAR